MATTSTKSTTSAKTRKKKTTDEPIEEVQNAVVEEAVPVEEPKPAATPKRSVPVKKDVDIHEYIPVRNGAHGKLVYISPRNHEVFVWDEFGDELEMELQELKNAKSASKKFYANNWFMFSEEYAWVIDYLGVGQYYANALDIDNYDSFFEQPADKIAKAISGMTDGQKRSLAFRARQLVASGSIDSNKVISALEEGLGIKFTEE